MDKYQGQQNDIVLLSLVRTRAVGHVRDVRRYAAQSLTLLSWRDATLRIPFCCLISSHQGAPVCSVCSGSLQITSCHATFATLTPQAVKASSHVQHWRFCALSHQCSGKAGTLQLHRSSGFIRSSLNLQQQMECCG